MQEPTKSIKYKYESREEALAARKDRASRARRERRRRAAEHLMAAQPTEKVHIQKRGGQKAWKTSVRRKYNRDVRRQKQRKQRRQAVNRQIWERLQATMPRVEEKATSLL